MGQTVTRRQNPQQTVPDTDLVPHVVQPGETLETVARDAQVSISDIAHENNFSVQRRLRAGETIYIPNPRARSMYTVQPNDNIDSIARRFGVNPAALAAANRDRLPRGPNHLRIGQSLYIPGTDARASRSAVTATQVPIPTPRPQPLAPVPTATTGVRTRPDIAAPVAPRETTGPRAVSNRPVAPLALEGLSAASFTSGAHVFPIKQLQRLLNRAGATPPLAVDGDAGRAVRSAIAQFQSRRSLPTDAGPRGSLVNSETWTALVAAAATPLEPTGVRWQVTAQDAQNPAILGAYRLVSVLAHDDPTRLRALLRMGAAQGGDGNIVIDRATLEQVARRITANGGTIGADRFTYDEASATVDIISGRYADRINPNNSRYDAQIRRIVDAEIARAAARGTRLPADFDLYAYVKAIICYESGFNPRRISSAGARGLGQFMPNTYGVAGITDPFNEEQSIRGTARYVIYLMTGCQNGRQVRESYIGRYAAERDACVAAMYNAGPGQPFGSRGVLRSDRAARSFSREYQTHVNVIYNWYRATNQPRG